MKWVRHSDFYRDEFLCGDHALPGDREVLPPAEAASGVKAAAAAAAGRERGGVSPHAEPAQSYWRWWRRAPSYPMIWFMMFWRKLISPLYGQVCGFYPSCSAYGLEAVTVHGLFRGSFLTGWRILRCNPFTGGGVDHVPASRRAWPVTELPAIVKLNHPPIPRDPS